MAAQGSDLVLIERGGALYKLTASELAALGGGGGGGNSVYGVATIDFGAFPGANEASVAVTGQAAILATSKPQAVVLADGAVGTHTANDHRYFATLVGLTCGTPTAATGFTIHARCLEKMQGQFQIRWVWAD